MGLGTTEILLIALVGVLGLVIWARTVTRRGARAFERERLKRGSDRQAEATHSKVKESAVLAQAPRVEKIVERQVLVMRRKFCEKLTPVDLAECGAKL